MTETCVCCGAEIPGKKSKHRYISFNGEKHTVSEWATITGIGKTTIKERLRRGWDAKSTLTKPVQKHIKASGEEAYSRRRLGKILSGMKQRCYNPNNAKYPIYGGRGIKVCEEWKDNFLSFYEWAVLNGYRNDLSIDRIDSNGNYEPSNCRWATQKEQQNNRRTNHLLMYNGETKTVEGWAETTGIAPATIRKRIEYGWSVEDALTMPVKEVTP